MTETRRRRKLAVLGGGLGSLAAVFELTSDPEWREANEVTVYQLGWRLGGKGASGRNFSRGARNEEHGIHMWMGFYARAFRMLEACYAEMEATPDNPLPTVDKAFVGQCKTSFTEFDDGPPWTWELEFPQIEGRPSDGNDRVELWQLVEAALAWLHQLIEKRARRFRWLRWLCRIFPFQGAHRYLAHLDTRPLEEFLAHAGRLAEAGEERALADVEDLLELADRLARAGSRLSGDLHGKTSERARRARELWYLIDVAAAALRGILTDHVWRDGYQAIDSEDFVAWLRKHGAMERASWCAPIRSIYDAMFAYRNGDASRPCVAAGTFLHSSLITFFGYKGSLYYQMQAGMGDVVFAPLYTVLKKRGVRFEFFTNVLALELDEAGNEIEAIRIGRQVEISAGRGAYDPLRPVKGLPCWPSAPLYDQLVNPDPAVDYEMPDVVGVEERLEKDRHFDHVLLGIPVGAHRQICRELIERKPEWRAMVDNIAVVPTLGMQLWLNRSWQALGGDDAIVGSGLPAQLSIRANSTAVVSREEWPSGDAPGALAYFCSTFQVPDSIALPVTDLRQWNLAKAAVREISIKWLDHNASLVWPQASSSGGNGLDPDYLYGGGQPAQRWDDQYFRPNVTPSELYVQSLPSTAQYRLKASQSGCRNLTLTGDWIDNEFLNAGFIEGTAAAAAAAAAAVRQLD